LFGLVEEFGAGGVGWVAQGVGKALLDQLVVDEGVAYEDVAQQAAILIGFGGVFVEGHLFAADHLAVLDGGFGSEVFEGGGVFGGVDADVADGVGLAILIHEDFDGVAVGDVDNLARLRGGVGDAEGVEREGACAWDGGRGVEGNESGRFGEGDEGKSGGQGGGEDQCGCLGGGGLRQGGEDGFDKGGPHSLGVKRGLDNCRRGQAAEHRDA